MTMTVRNNQNWIPSIFNELFDNDWVVRRPTFSEPAINIVDKENSFEVEVAAPGMTKEDFTILVNDDNNLVISMDKKESNEEKEEGKYLRREFSHTKFKRTLLLSDTIDKDQITAKVDSGILKITLPKLTQSEIQKPERLIEIL